MAFQEWMMAILQIVVVLIGGHLTITKLLPLLKEGLVYLIKKEEVVNSTISVFILFIGVIVLKKLVEFLVDTGNTYLSYINVLTPGIDIILEVFPFVLYFMLAIVAVSGFAKK